MVKQYLHRISESILIGTQCQENKHSTLIAIESKNTLAVFMR